MFLLVFTCLQAPMPVCTRVGVFWFFCYRGVCLSLISEPVAVVTVQDNKKTISLTLQGEGMLWSSV